MNFNVLPGFLNKPLKTILKDDFQKFHIVETTNIFNIENHSGLELLINYENTNNFRYINKFHEAVNNVLIDGGIYCSCAEDKDQRKLRKWEKSSFFVGPLIVFIDFIYKRVFPKLPIIKKIYFTLTRDYNRVMSKAEILGRLVSCGFKILEIIDHDGLTYVIAMKIREPYFDLRPSYGIIFKMKRIGKNKKIIDVYKIRTMHPYSEYLQEYIIEKNKLQKSGKIAKDYRITYWGKIFRRLWLDELPMLINWIKRDLSLVGVRALSEHYFSLYPKELQDLRIQFKPGLIPPYYADLPKNFDEILESERQYLLQKKESPFLTDFKIFWKAIYNIIFNKARSH
jgi:lipopolysaccharide/colanic/teichoic acid biosynthesis glycosyltransferase